MSDIFKLTTLETFGDTLLESHPATINNGDSRFREETYGLTLVNRVMKIKRFFRVSYKTVLMRLIENGISNQDIWKKFNWAFQREIGRKISFKEEPMGSDSEPFRIARYDFFEDRLSRLTRLAIEQDKISISRGAEILRISIEGMQDLISDWEVAP